MASDNQWIIISLGGSMVAPKSGIDTGFVRDFRALSQRLVADGSRLAIIVGGGRPAREYQEAARALDIESSDALDRIGIMATRLNAEFVRHALAVRNPLVIDPNADAIDPAAHVIVGAGWEPGCSTDYDAALLAKRIGAKRIVNVSNVAYVYSADPRTHPDAERYADLTWERLRGIIGDEWRPGMNVPFDPVAARLCRELGAEVMMVAGDDLANVERALRGQEFEGTRIHL